MKRIFFFLSLLTIFGCSNNGPDPSTTPPVINPPAASDTLSAGWSEITLPSSSLVLDIYFINESTGYLSQYGEGISKTTDGGHTWTKIFDVLYALNIYGTPDGKLFFVNNSNNIYSTLDGGVTFDSTYLPNVYANLKELFFLDNNTGFIAGYYNIFGTTDGGATWDSIGPMIGEHNFAIFQTTMFFRNPTKGWLVSGTQFLRSTDNNTNWLLPATTFTASEMTGVTATDDETVYVSGSFSYFAYIYKSIDGGENFSTIATLNGTGAAFYTDIQFTDVNTGYVCFDKKLYKTMDAGQSWQPVVSLANDYFVEIHFLNANHGWACGSNGKVFIYNQ